MKRADLFLYVGIGVLLVGLISFFVTTDRTDRSAPVAPDVSEPVTGSTPVPEQNLLLDGEEADSDWLGMREGWFSTLGQEINRLANRLWKDGLTDGQREALEAMGERAAGIRNFALSLEFLIILISTLLLLLIYHLISNRKIPWLLKKTPSARPEE